MKSLTILILLCAAAASAEQSFQFVQNGRTYTVTTQAMGTILGGTFGQGRALYDPSVITPSWANNNQYALLFTSNLTPGDTGLDGEGIYLLWSNDGYTPDGSPTAILKNTTINGICDMAGVRAIWDGSEWHMYVQVLSGDYATHSCGTSNFIIEATGPTLTSLSWLVDDTNTPIPVIYSDNPGIGIGEGEQWFVPYYYGGPPSYPIMVTYNDWGNPGGGAEIADYLSPDGTNVYWWYDMQPAYDGRSGIGVGAIFPDVMLGSSLDFSTVGNPALVLGSSCNPGSEIFNYIRGLGFYLNPAPYPNYDPADGVFVAISPGQFESTSSDSNGPIGLAPKFARNPYGYLDNLSSTSPAIWQSFVYYNDAQTSRSVSDNCSYNAWHGSPMYGQKFSVSQVTVTQQ